MESCWLMTRKILLVLTLLLLTLSCATKKTERQANIKQDKEMINSADPFDFDFNRWVDCYLTREGSELSKEEASQIRIIFYSIQERIEEYIEKTVYKTYSWQCFKFYEVNFGVGLYKPMKWRCKKWNYDFIFGDASSKMIEIMVNEMVVKNDIFNTVLLQRHENVLFVSRDKIKNLVVYLEAKSENRKERKSLIHKAFNNSILYEYSKCLEKDRLLEQLITIDK